MSARYHAFWVNPYGSKRERLSTHDLDKILQLRLRQDSEGSDVRDLVVIYGDVLEFEPVRIVDSYRIKVATEK